MSCVTESTLDAALADAVEALEDNAAQRAEFESLYHQRKSTLDLATLNTCVEQYVHAEMDSDTPGDRGLGRVSTEPPRLGAYFRSGISRLSDDKRAEMSSLICALVCRGYIAALMFGKEQPRKPLSGDELYKKWIPVIYGASPPDSVWDLVGGVGESAFERFKQFLKDNNMTGGGIFSKDKTDQILAYYLIAGYALRSSEIL